MNALQKWMDARELKDAEVASRIEGLSRSQISRIRRGKSIPSPETAKKLSALTKIPAQKFIFVEHDV